MLIGYPLATSSGKKVHLNAVVEFSYVPKKVDHIVTLPVGKLNARSTYDMGSER